MMMLMEGGQNNVLWKDRKLKKLSVQNDVPKSNFIHRVFKITVKIGIAITLSNLYQFW